MCIDCPNKSSINTVPDTYICNICNIPGHFIRNCPEIAVRELERKQNGVSLTAGTPPMRAPMMSQLPMTTASKGT